MIRRVVVSVEWRDDPSQPFGGVVELARVLEHLGHALEEIQDYAPRATSTIALAAERSEPKASGGPAPSPEPSAEASPKRSHKKKASEPSGEPSEGATKRGPGRPRKIRNGLVALPRTSTPPVDDRQLAITPSDL